MKRSLMLMLLPLLVWGCNKQVPEPTSAPTGKGSISGTVRVKKPVKSLIFVALAESFDELTLGRAKRVAVLRRPGPFQFKNVDAGTYRLGAFVDINRSTRPEISVEPYAVLESSLLVSANTDIENISVDRFFNERNPSFRTHETVARYRELRKEAKAAVNKAYQKLKSSGDDLLVDVIPSLRAMVFEAEMKWAVAGNEADWEHIKTLLEPVPALASVALNGNNALGTLRGCFLRAYLSDLDGSIQRYAIYVPEEYDGSRPFPLILALHGAGSDHWSGMKMVTGTTDFLVGAEEANNHFFPQSLPPDFIIACPNGHGYNGPGYGKRGEYDVMKVFREMHSHYNIDSDRVYLTGASKGGRGTWEIGLKYPTLFAGLAPVCGSTGGIQDLADNAVGLDIHVFHGARDLIIPVNESRVMVERLAKLGVSVAYDEPEDMGHDAAWRIYKDGAIFDRFRN